MDLQLIQTKIYTIRNQKVTLDRDLAEIYGVTTGNLNKSVKRNIERFPEVFMFHLSKSEFNLIFQIGISSWGGNRNTPYAFTELGVAMLSSVLNSKTAIEVNMSIMRAFVYIRQTLISKPAEQTSKLESEITELKAYLEEIFSDQNDINEVTRIQIELINHTLAEMQTDKFLFAKPRKRIGFETGE